MNDEINDRLSNIEAGIDEIISLVGKSSTVTIPMPSDPLMCNEHGEALKSAVSKKTGKPYKYHKNEEGQICFGFGYKS